MTDGPLVVINDQQTAVFVLNPPRQTPVFYILNISAVISGRNKSISAGLNNDTVNSPTITFSLSLLKVVQRCQKYAELQPFVFVDSNFLLVHVELC